MSPETVTAESPRRGRTRITTRALSRVVSAVTADTLHVQADHVAVTLADDKGQLVLTVSTPINIVALPRVTKDPSVVIRTGGTILHRAHAAQQQIRARVSELTGSRIDRVSVHLTAADIQPEKRVK